MFYGKRSELESNQIVVPEAYIIDELHEQENDAAKEYGYSMPHLYDFDISEKLPDQSLNEQTVIIIEL